MRTLFAVLLAARGRVVPVSRIVDEIWYDGRGRRQRDPRNLVHQYVMRLRRQLGDHNHSVLVTQATGYSLSCEPAQLDARRFEELATRGQEQLTSGDLDHAFDTLGKALALWRGTPLEGVPPAPSIVAEAARLEEARLTAAEMRIDVSHRLGRHFDTLSETHALRDANPLREGLWEKEMIALRACGRRADALELYQEARRTLREELGLEPSTRLRVLQQELLAG
ncbi:BTAD domain-containing putative transcriptional regulator [Streptomyces sp. NPDC101165]|uniref:AfsR/SARP family transcriptional regulator n=1 Tax=Streptomyces sp. NPDC101165 TaxID=3366119 RepID=UPI00382CFBFE